MRVRSAATSRQSWHFDCFKRIQVKRPQFLRWGRFKLTTQTWSSCRHYFLSLPFEKVGRIYPRRAINNDARRPMHYRITKRISLAAHFNSSDWCRATQSILKHSKMTNYYFMQSDKNGSIPAVWIVKLGKSRANLLAHAQLSVLALTSSDYYYCEKSADSSAFAFRVFFSDDSVSLFSCRARDLLSYLKTGAMPCNVVNLSDRARINMFKTNISTHQIICL